MDNKTIESKPSNLPGGGPAGATLWLLEYLSQSNDSANCVSQEDRFKFVVDLTILEIVNFLTIGISSHNLKAQVPNDVPTHNQKIKPSHLKSQTNSNFINNWTKKNKMLINKDKIKTKTTQTNINFSPE